LPVAAGRVDFTKVGEMFEIDERSIETTFTD
jgi:hypothetical protein